MVTVPPGAAVSTRAAQLRPTTQAVGGDLRRAEQRLAYAFPRADVPALPRGSVVVLTDTSETFRVDAIEDVPSDQFHAAVLVPMVAP